MQRPSFRPCLFALAMLLPLAVQADTFTRPWIEDLAATGITVGCGGGNYCPSNPNTRGQMAVFIVKTFTLQ
jgi:hypothetical protein